MTENGLVEANAARSDQPLEAERRQLVRVGRKRDHTRDAVILDAALEVLAEAGYAV